VNHQLRPPHWGLGEGLYYKTELYIFELEQMLYAEDVPNQLLQRFRSVQKQHLGRRSRPAKLQAGKP